MEGMEAAHLESVAASQQMTLNRTPVAKITSGASG
jgi:hypothetical protein